MTELHDLLGISEERIAELIERFNRIILGTKREAEVIVAIEREPSLTLREKLFLAEILGKTVEANRPRNIRASKFRLIYIHLLRGKLLWFSLLRF